MDPELRSSDFGMLARTVFNVARNQARKAVRVLSGRPAMSAPLGSMTLDRDDLEQAKEWLGRQAEWHDAAPIQQFEDEFAEWNGSGHAVSFAAGRVALSACIHALRLEPGDEVVVPGYTCVVVPNALHFAGVRTTYSDIELDTFGLDIESLKRRVGPATKAILVHHLYGLVARDFAEILDFASQRGIAVIEDCAQATGAEFQGRKVGNFGDVAFYSCEQSKVMNTVEGGIAVTGNQRLASRLREFQNDAPFPSKNHVALQLRTHIKNYYEVKHPRRHFAGDISRFRYGTQRVISTTKDEIAGVRPVHYGCRMASPIAALGSVQLRKVDHYNHLRRETARRWDGWCRDQGYETPLVIDESVPVWLRYPVMTQPAMKRDLAWAEASLGIRPGVWFVSHLHPAPELVGDCPNADKAVAQCINFPTLLYEDVGPETQVASNARADGE